MEVEIISKEIIKPSASTPQHLRTYKLSLIDQLCPRHYIPILLFYSPTFENPHQKSDLLKISLSQTLTHFYPLAGRMKDDSTIDCNDDGATYIETHIASHDMSSVIQQPVDIDDHLQRLLQFDPYLKSSELSTDQVLLAIQVNNFACGGVAISVCIWHGVADTCSLGTFINSWSAIARGANENIIIDGVIIGCSSVLFPPLESLSLSFSDMLKEDQIRNSVMKRFVFDGTKIAKLRGKIGNIGPNLDRPTRFQAVSALIFGALKMNTASIVVDIRKRLNPPLPQQSFGNILHGAVVCWTKDENLLDYNGLAEKVRDSIKSINDEQLRKIREEVKEFIEAARNSPNVIFNLSSWCRFPFYDADFGWGKPIWVGSALRVSNACILLDTRDGEGIEALVGLSQEDMVKFEQNPDILAYASLSPKRG